MRFRVLPEADAEAIEAALWYEEREALLGNQFLAETQVAFQRIRHDARTLSLMEEYTGEFEIRRLRLKRFPYLVVVLCRPDETVVVAVAHTRRKPMYWLDRIR